MHLIDRLPALAMVLGILFVFIYPLTRILKRMGFSRWYIFLGYIVPFGPIIGLWVVSFAKWPNFVKEEAPDEAC